MLFSKLKNYAASGVYPFHMPGHKRNAEFLPPGLLCDIDITEIYDFDDLHNPQGVLFDTAKLAAEKYSSLEAFLLINGSTVGILAGIGAHTKRGDKILTDSNCHRSVTNAAELFGLEVSFITPDIDEQTGVPCSITPESVKAALKDNSSIKLVVLTSPSYEGVVSDIETIADITHKAGALLFVDCSHGAHFGFSDVVPESPVTLGADIVVVSLHKTLPALTQCSLLHICSEQANASATKHLLSILQTSSPSYILMASIDSCLRLLKTERMLRLDYEYSEHLKEFYGMVTTNCKHLRFPFMLKNSSFYDYDIGKIIIVVKNTILSGFELSDTLRKQHKIELERACDDYAIAMTSICDTNEGFCRLFNALIEIDSSL